MIYSKITLNKHEKNLFSLRVTDKILEETMATIGDREKLEIIETHRVHDKDTGSSEVQIAILTERINHLIEHLKRNKKDHHTRRGLLKLVGRRRKFEAYLKRTNRESYVALATKLKLKIKD